MLKIVELISASPIVCILVVFFAESPLYKRLNKPNYIKFMRFTCSLGSLASAVFILITTLYTVVLFTPMFNNSPISKDDRSDLIIAWVFSIMLLYWFFKYWRYFIFSNDNTILAGWYVNRHLDLIKKEDFQSAHECLQKAAELEPNSVQAWGSLANFTGLFSENLQQADKYLAKAQHVYESSTEKRPEDHAVLEHYAGKIMQYRDDHEAAIAHLKKAWEIDPTPYRKKEYEKAVEWVNENEEPAEF